MIDTPLIIGLDLGTTICKAAAYTPAGEQVAQADTSVDTYRPEPGWAEQSPTAWKEAVSAVLSQVSANLDKRRALVRAIGVSTHGPSVVFTDADFKPLAHAPIWQDQRSASYGRALMEQIGLEWIGLGLPETGFPAQLRWFQEHQPDTVKAATHVLSAKGYIIAFLTGHPLDEPSSSPPVESWLRDPFLRHGMTSAKLAKFRPSTSVAGLLRTELAAQVGLPSHIEVVMGLNDGAAATLGAGLIQPGEGIVSLSTNGVARAVIEQRVAGDIQLENSLFCYAYVEDLYITGGFTKAAGDCLRWFLDIAYADNTQNGPLQVLEAEARGSGPGADGVLFLPHLMGPGTPRASEEPQGSFMFLARHHSRGHLARAVMEGVCYAIRDIGDVFKRMGVEWQDLRLTGGASRNELWRQILADILDQRLTRVTADSTLGAAIVASCASGLFSSGQEAVATMTQPLDTVKPDLERVRFYEEQYILFRQAQRLVRNVADTRGKGA